MTKKDIDELRKDMRNLRDDVDCIDRDYAPFVGIIFSCIIATLALGFSIACLINISHASSTSCGSLYFNESVVMRGGFYNHMHGVLVKDTHSIPSSIDPYSYHVLLDNGQDVGIRDKSEVDCTQ